MSGGLFVSALAHETGRVLKRDEIQQIQQLHAEAFRRYSPQVRPLPGARELMAYLAQAASHTQSRRADIRRVPHQL
jgi:beta-phosphoglucomutase-like phosphatase (HAD superfamily)